ncbi:TRAP transporter substrate-binding protein [Thermophagus xiamenensis]|uniref:Tripartite ATP-independent transporter solute receptor, DctP family n=1 Tax=Thermophagus xiamenensis TaxID=385682 RepID=A0A1I2BDR2_9BACT|nr:TRAP transporter substrate-binding protein [Thermophagus xiamenensis]SFE54236.1 tripartite ATP-independent transporter solute receptor, DctP family [Thermophagus xiamenensis]
MNKLITVLLAILFFASAGCGLKKEVKVLKLGHGLDTKHSVHIAMEFMAKRVNELSNGKLKIEIYPGGVLGSERESLELLQLGSLDMTKVSSAALEGFVEEYKIFGLPYIFKSREHAFAVLDGPLGQEILNKGEEYWLKGLCFYDAGARSFYSSTPIQSPEDLKGLKIRVMQSITSFEMVKAMGGSPTPISWGELYTALQGKVVDGAENNPPSFYLSHHYEVCRYYTLNEHTRLPDVLIMSTHALEKLTSQEKDWLMQAVRESVPVQRKEWQKSEENALKAVIEDGVEIIKPDKQPFIDGVSEVYNLYKDNEKLWNLIQRIQQSAPSVKAQSENSN